MRTVNVALDLYSAAVCLVLAGSLFRSRGERNRLRTFFNSMCLVNLTMALADITNWTCEGFARPWYPAALWLGTVVYWLCAAPLILAFTAYLVEYLSPRVRVAKIFWRLAVLLSVFYLLGCLLSIRNGVFFRIDERNLYQRGSWFLASQVITFGIYAVDVALFVTYRKVLTYRDFWTLSQYIILPIVMEVIQMCNYGIALLNTGTTMALLLIFINIQSERELQAERQKKELAESRIAITLSQIQPHFLYNALFAISHLCDTDPPQAKAAISDFSQFLRGNMKALSSRQPIPFAQELEHTQHYLQLEKRRFQERLQIRYEITVRDFALPPLVLQPLVENAVRHGICRREEGGCVLIRTRETASAYEITVQDDGVGFTDGAEDGEGRPHIGISNVRKRLAAMCGGTLTICSEDGAGTTATIAIPKGRGAQ